ncbi:MAG: DNA polymerase III subunit gamma/tau [Oscillospiraceae bacterium]|nr:DNA polymerase III subunit gamma/tau [Oscillospiraceae bacterium]MCL2248334.1 DNA polymerase III subunit gamma/tau [Oscillospiraceae bacterium]
MYKALYRKYRPRGFSDVTGQEHITETLRRQIETDRLSHAYLFVGTRGTGKTTCAKILSRAVNCLAPENGSPCNKCSACLGIEDGSILDVLELDAASNNSVDNVRALRDEAIFSPASVRKRVYIVDEVHMLSTAAFNALLKILEEPPEHILFILATTELHKVPETIQSRCQKYSFKRLASNSIIDRLNHIAVSEGLTLTDDAVQRLASLADGSMRDAVSLFDQCVSDKTIDLSHVEETLGLAGKQKLMQIATAMHSQDIGETLRLLDELYSDGKDMAALLSELTGLKRDILIHKLTPDTALLSSGVDISSLTELSEKFTSDRLLYNLEVFKDGLFGLSGASSPRLAVEMCLIRACVGESAPNLPIEQQGAEAPPPPAEPQEPESQEPEPQEPEPSPAPPKPPPTKTGDDITGLILRQIADPPVRALLSDSTKVRITENDNVLTIRTPDTFNAEMIRSEYKEILMEAASKALGKKVTIEVETGEIESNSDKRSKLESLSAFGVVDFE